MRCLWAMRRGLKRWNTGIRIEGELGEQERSRPKAFRAVVLTTCLTITGPNFLIIACLDARPRTNRLMSGTMKPKCRKIVLCGIVLGLVLALPACTDFKKDFLCRPAGHCVDARDGGTGYN